MRLLDSAAYLVLFGVTFATNAQSPTDAQIQADVRHSLDNKRFANVQIAVQNGIVTLSGHVDLYSAKEDA